MAEYFVLAGGKKYLPDMCYITTTRFFLDDKNTPADIRDDRGDTPLNVAAFAGQYAAVEELLGHSADVDAKNNKVGAGTVPAIYIVQYYSVQYQQQQHAHNFSQILLVPMYAHAPCNSYRTR